MNTRHCSKCQVAVTPIASGEVPKCPICHLPFTIAREDVEKEVQHRPVGFGSSEKPHPKRRPGW